MNLQSINASASPEVQSNENFETLDHQSVYGKRQPVTTGVTWGYYGGRWGGVAITAGTLTLGATATNYVVVLKSTGAISTSTASTNWDNTELYARVYKITTASSVVTATEDHRAGLYGVMGFDTTILAANEATDTSSFIAFVTAATGQLQIKTNANLTFNSNTGMLTSLAATITTLTATNLSATVPTTGWYSPSADLIRTPNSVTIDDTLTVSGVSLSVVGNGYIGSSNVSASNGQLRIGVGAANSYVLNIAAATVQKAFIYWDNTGSIIEIGAGAAGVGTKLLYGNGAAGLTLDGTTGACTLAGNLTVSGTGPHAIGGATDATVQLFLRGAFSGTQGLNVSSNITVTANADGYGALFQPTLNKAGSGTHVGFNGVSIEPPTIGAGAATLTNASTLKITGAPTGATNNYALWVAAGNTLLGGNLVVSGAKIETAGYAAAHSATGTPAGGTNGTGLFMGSANISVTWGSGAPTLTAAQGSLYLRTDGGASTRLYSNNNGSTGWSAITSA